MTDNGKDTPLPDGWRWLTLAECATVIQGQSPPGETYNTQGHGLPFFQGKAEFGDLYPTAVKWCSAPTKIAAPDDVLISVRAPVGPTNLATTECCIGRGLAAVRPLNGTPSRYLLYALRRFESDLASKATGSTFSAISGAQLRAQMIPLPPLPEQHRIVAAIETHLTRLDAAVAALERARARLKRYRAAVLKAACEGRLVPTEATLARTGGHPYEPGPALLARIQESRVTIVGAHGRAPARRQQLPASLPANLPNLPEGWAWATLDQLLVKLRNGISARPDAGEDGVRILRINAVRPMRVDMKEVRYLSGTDHDYTDYGLQVGDLLFTRYNGSPDLVGVCAAVHSVPAFTTHPDKVIVGRVHEVNPNCLEVFLNTGESRAHIARNTKTTAGQAGISGSDLRITPIPVPPLAEQERIVAEVERRLSVLDQLDAAVTTNLKRADALRQSVLRRAFSGTLASAENGLATAVPLLQPPDASALEHPMGDRAAIDTTRAQLGLALDV